MTEGVAARLGRPAKTAASVADLRLSAGPLIAILGPSCATSESLEEAAGYVQGRPDLATILLAEHITTELLQTALRSGVRDVLTHPADPDALNATIGRIEATLPVLVATPGGDVAVPPPPGAESGRVITVFSTKGGAGKSVIATNLAIALAKRSDKPIALVDADLQFGDVAVMLKLAPRHTIVDAIGSLDRLDQTLLEELMVRHEASGLWILPAPLEPSFADQISADEVVRIVEVLRTFCGHVVVDTPAYFNEVVLGLIEQSDDVLLIAGMDIPNIKNVKIGLQTLRLLNVPDHKLKLILNRANSKVKLDVGEVERTLQTKAEVLVPSDIVVPQTVNKGVPLVLDAPRSGVAKSIEQLADRFLPARGGRRR